MSKAVVVRYVSNYFLGLPKFWFLIEGYDAFFLVLNCSDFPKFNYLLTFFWSYDKMGVNKIHPNKRSCACSHLQDFQLHSITMYLTFQSAKVRHLNLHF